MPIIKDRNKWSIDKDFIISQYDPLPWTIKPDGIEADEHGMRYAHKGSFIDKDGKVITLTDAEGALTFSSDPIGILTERINVTYGPVVGSILQRGVIQAEYLPYPDGVEYKTSFDKSIREKLPLILTWGGQEFESEEEEEEVTPVTVAIKQVEANKEYNVVYSGTVTEEKIKIQVTKDTKDITSKEDKVTIGSSGTTRNVKLTESAESGAYEIIAKYDNVEEATQEFIYTKI